MVFFSITILKFSLTWVYLFYLSLSFALFKLIILFKTESSNNYKIFTETKSKIYAILWMSYITNLFFSFSFRLTCYSSTHAKVTYD